MGTLFSFMQSGVDVSDIYVDFKTAKPKADEEPLCTSTRALINESGPPVIEQLRQYQACGELIRKALSDPTAANEREAFEAVKPNILIINNFYQIGAQLEGLFPELLKSLAKDDEKRSIQEYQAVSKTVADTIEFALLLDELKMLKPGIQNDFAYYKRALSRKADDPSLVVRDEMASMISMFIAQPIPIMNVLSKSARRLADNNPNVGKTLATMANVCLHLVRNNAFADDPTTNLLCVKAMVGCIVIFDHVDPSGAFVKRSGINIKQAVTLLTRDFASQTGLLNAIRYSTVHYSDDSTPSSITQMLEATGR